MRRMITGYLIQLVVMCVCASFAFSAACGGANGAPHPNGGGFVATTATVHAVVYVGPDAEVCDTARIWQYGLGATVGQVQIYGNARIYGAATVSGNVRIYDNARVYGNAAVVTKYSVCSELTFSFTSPLSLSVTVVVDTVPAVTSPGSGPNPSSTVSSSRSSSSPAATVIVFV